MADSRAETQSRREAAPWPKVRLGEICEIRKGQAITKRESNPGPYPVILGGREPAYFIDRFNHTGKAMVISRSGASAGYVSRWNEPIFVTDGFLIEPKENCTFDYLYYTLKCKQQQLFDLKRGSAIPHVTPSLIATVYALLPPLSIQHAIAGRLAAYDHLIENNRRRIAILERKAEQLYKEWFVRRRFPGHEKAKWIGGLPEGWMEGKAEDFFSITIGKTPPRKEFHWFTRNDANAANWLSIADMKGMFISYTDEQLTAEAIARFKMIVLPVDTILLSFKLTVGRVAIVDTPCATNEAIAHFRYTQKCLREYAYLYLKNFEYKRLGNTSAIGNAINSKIVKGMPFVMPTESLLALFHERARKIIDLVKVLQKQNALLARERDLLLPRLMSGRVKP